MSAGTAEQKCVAVRLQGFGLNPNTHEEDTVIKRYLMTTTAALMCSGLALGAQATQQPQTQQPAQPSEPRAAAQAQGQTTTLTGCVYRERDVPGRAPNPAERVGILEDYILAEVKPAGQGATQSASGTSATGATGTAGTTGAAGSAAGRMYSMYKLELVDDEKLQAMVGKRVEVTGRVDAEAGDARGATPPAQTSGTDRALGIDAVDLPEFEVTNIREVSGTCPTTPSRQ